MEHPGESILPTFSTEFTVVFHCSDGKLDQSLNIDKLNPIAVADLVHSVVKGKKLIHRSGINSVKITCKSLKYANALLGSPKVTENKYRVCIQK